MGTRSRIGIKLDNGLFMSVYCHWDGYPSHNGMILLNHYQTHDKVMELLSYGDMSTLGPNIGSKHDFNDREGEHENSCTFYKRDRGETNVDAVTHRSFAEIMQEEYAYIFMDNKWYFIDCYKNETVVLLTEEICKQE